MPINNQGAYTQLTAKKEGDVYKYQTKSGIVITTSNNDGSIYVDDQGRVYAQNLKGANIKGTDKNDNISLYDCQVDSADMGKGDETLNAMGTTSFASQVVFGDNKGDKFNVENKDTAFNGIDDWCKGMWNRHVNTDMSAQEKAHIMNNKSGIQAQEKAQEEAKKAAEEAAKKAEEEAQKAKLGSPKESEITVDQWFPNQNDKNNCLWNIAKNNYGDLLSDDQILDACKTIAEHNGMSDINETIYPGQNMQLPQLEVGDDGKWTGNVVETPKKDADGKTIVPDDFVGPLTPDQVRESEANLPDKEAEASNATDDKKMAMQKKKEDRLDKTNEADKTQEANDNQVTEYITDAAAYQKALKEDNEKAVNMLIDDAKTYADKQIKDNYDTNGDGVIDKDEYTVYEGKALQEQYPDTKDDEVAPAIEPVFNNFDLNDDGVIDTKEQAAQVIYADLSTNNGFNGKIDDAEAGAIDWMAEDTVEALKSIVDGYLQ